MVAVCQACSLIVATAKSAGLTDIFELVVCMARCVVFGRHVTIVDAIFELKNLDDLQL